MYCLPGIEHILRREKKELDVFIGDVIAKRDAGAMVLVASVWFAIPLLEEHFFLQGYL